MLWRLCAARPGRLLVALSGFFCFEVFVLLGGGLLSDIHKYADCGRAQEHAGSAGAYEGQGDSFCGQHDGDDAYVEGGLDCDGEGDSGGEELSEAVLASDDNPKAEADE